MILHNVGINPAGRRRLGLNFSQVALSAAAMELFDVVVIRLLLNFDGAHTLKASDDFWQYRHNTINISHRRIGTERKTDTAMGNFSIVFGRHEDVAG